MKAFSIFGSATLALVVLFSSMQARALDCFHNLEEYKAQSDHLPPLLKKIPMLGAVDAVIVGVPAVATLKVRMAGNRFKYEGRKLDKNEIKDQSDYIREICYDSNHIEITLENKESYRADFIDGGFKFRKNFFVQIDFVSDEKEFARVTHKMEEAKKSPAASVYQQNSGVQ